MRCRLICLATVAACYTPQAAPGAPCTPSLANCPSTQRCELVSGSYVCVANGGSPPMPDAPAEVDGSLADAATVGGWALVQSRGAMANNVLLQPTGAKHLLVVAVESSTATATVTSLTDDAGNLYLPIIGSRSSSSQGGFGVELWYVGNTKAGATKVTTATGQIPIGAIYVWEVAGIRADLTIASVAALSDQAATTMPLGASITTTQPGELVVSVAVVNNTVSGIAPGSGFTSDSTLYGDGWAHLTDRAAPPGTYQARWLQPNAGVYCTSSAAFFAAP